MKSTKLLVTKETIYQIKEPKYLVPVDTETNKLKNCGSKDRRHISVS